MKFDNFYHIVQLFFNIHNVLADASFDLRGVSRQTREPTQNYTNRTFNLIHWVGGGFDCSNSVDQHRVQVIFIIMSCRQHGYPRPSLATSPYRSSLLADPQGYILYPYIAAVRRFELVSLLLIGHMCGSIGVHHLWARPCFSSSALHVWFI